MFIVIINILFGWWFGTFLFVHSVGNHHPNWRTQSIIFQRGRAKNHQPDDYSPSLTIIMNHYENRILTTMLALWYSPYGIFIYAPLLTIIINHYSSYITHVDGRFYHWFTQNLLRELSQPEAHRLKDVQSSPTSRRIHPSLDGFHGKTLGKLIETWMIYMGYTRMT